MIEMCPLSPLLLLRQFQQSNPCHCWQLRCRRVLPLLSVKTFCFAAAAAMGMLRPHYSPLVDYITAMIAPNPITCIPHLSSSCHCYTCCQDKQGRVQLLLFLLLPMVLLQLLPRLLPQLFHKLAPYPLRIISSNSPINPIRPSWFPGPIPLCGNNRVCLSI